MRLVERKRRGRKEGGAEKKGVRVVCGKKATSDCASCKPRAYCSKAHQRDDWKDHKVECKRSVKARGTATVLHWLANIQDCTIT